MGNRRSPPNELLRARALELALVGRSSTEIAEELEVDRRTVNRWRSTPEWIEEVAERQAELRESLHDRLLARACEMGDVLVEVATRRIEDEDGVSVPAENGMSRVHAVRVFFELIGTHKGAPVTPPARSNELETEDDVVQALDGIPAELLERALERRRAPGERDL